MSNETQQNWPTTQEMFDQLSASGVLTAQTPIPDDYLKMYVGKSEEQIGTLGLAQSGNTELAARLELLSSFLHKWIPKTVGALLTLQGLRGVWNSIMFIFVEFPGLEAQLIANEITSQELRTIIAKAVMLVITTIVSMFFGLKLAMTHTKVAKKINSVIGMLLLFINITLLTIFALHDQGLPFQFTTTYFMLLLQQFIN